MSAIDKEKFPQGALYAAGALVLLTIVAAGVGRYQKVNAPPSPDMVSLKPAASVDLSFFDEADGSVTVRKTHGGAFVATLAPDTNGFLRTTLRGMASDRRERGLDRAPPFRFARWHDGRITLEDTATGKRISLRAFGETQRDAVEDLLNKGLSAS